MCRLIKSQDVKMAEMAMKALENKLPMMLTLLGNGDDDISASVTQFAHDYLGLLKQLSKLSDQQKATVQVGYYTRNRCDKQLKAL